MGSILVTGGAGFIGSHVVDELIKEKRKVVVLDNLSGGFIENVNKKAEFVKGSVTNERLVKSLFDSNNIDYIFHLAAYAAEGLSPFIRRFNYNNNLIGSINLINESINNNVKCFVFTSSIAIYGSNQVPMKENMAPTPEDPYGISKLAVEQDLKAAKSMFGLDYIIFRLHNVYGERQNINDKYRNVVGIFVRQLIQNKPLTIFGDGEQKRAFTYIGDVAPIIADSIKIGKAYNQIFNIGSDMPYTINQLAEAIKKQINPNHSLKYLPQRREVLFAYADHNKAKRLLGYKSQVDLEEGIKRTLEWAKKAGIKREKEYKNIEIRKKIQSIGKSDKGESK